MTARRRFGQGEYRYFDHPLPQIVSDLRAAFWPHLLRIARDWPERLGRADTWPDDFDDWLNRCHEAGQNRPTPLLLRYGPGGWNALHRDLYGDLVFPLQVVVGLDEPGVDFNGGEFLVVENRMRPQSRATATQIAARSERRAVRSPSHIGPDLPRRDLKPVTLPAGYRRGASRPSAMDEACRSRTVSASGRGRWPSSEPAFE